MLQRFLMIGSCCALSFGVASVGRASCAAMEPQHVQISVSSCKKVDTKKIKESGYPGLIVEGKDGVTKITAWVPESEGRTCSDLKAKTIKATLTHACCDGDPNPPCLLEMSETLKSLKVVGVKK